PASSADSFRSLQYHQRPLPTGKGLFVSAPCSVTEKYSIAPVDSILDIDAESFRRLTPANDPFLSRAFLAALERHGAAASRLGWTPQHLVARNRDDEIVGILPLYIKTNSFGEFIYDWSWARAFEQSGLPYYPKLFSGIPYTPAMGPRFWVNGHDADNIRAALINAAISLAQQHQLSSWHVAFP